MSYYSELPQTPRATRPLQYEESPSSSSGNAIAEESEVREEATFLRKKNDDLMSSGAMAPSTVLLGNGDLKGQHDSLSSPFLNSLDPRSASPLLYSCGTAYPNGYDTLVTNKTFSNKMYHFWINNRNYLLVIISTFFGSLMTLLTKLLQNDDHGMHVFQILFLRMAASWVVCVASLYYTRLSEFPFGPKDVRWLLLLRGAFGFVGIGGLWTGLSYLNLSDATVITFLTPSMIAGYSAIFMNEPFPRKEMAASFLAMVGVVFIARPVAIFGPAPKDSVPPVAPGVGDGHPMTPPSTADDEARASTERLMGTVLCLISAVGGTGALLSVKKIGTRASVLTTTSYFALISMIVSTMILVLAPPLGIDQPHLHFALPDGVSQWLYVGVITLCGLATQLLMTLGFGSEGRSNKAPAMLYTGMLWTTGFDRWAFGKEMHWTSIIGIFLIVGGALFMALQPRTPAARGLIVEDEEDGIAGDRELELELELESVNGDLATHD